MIGASGDPELAEFVEGWAKKHPSDPRRDLFGGAGASQEPAS
jgi:hypothetical protein